MRLALDPTGHRVPRTKPTCLLHTWRLHRRRPFALVLHLHRHQSSRNLHLQYLAKNQSTQRCQSLTTQGSDHPPVLEPHMVLTRPKSAAKSVKGTTLLSSKPHRMKMTRRHFKSGSSCGRGSAALDCPMSLTSKILQPVWRLVYLRRRGGRATWHARAWPRSSRSLIPRGKSLEWGSRVLVSRCCVC
jgi:hypothetical protein